MELLGYKMVNDELMATVKSDHGHIFRYSFKIETPEYEILEVLEEVNRHVDNGRHHRGATSYHPKMMLKVILYAYTQSVFS
ncbi:hypothetical protein, partial [Staphylococcus haemolyticus]|uniref:hypothetical protein n=2 Tax=Staphylococcus haemolyticus TaxID=1283 RepID=UPI00069DA5FE